MENDQERDSDLLAQVNIHCKRCSALSKLKIFCKKVVKTNPDLSGRQTVPTHFYYKSSRSKFSKLKFIIYEQILKKKKRKEKCLLHKYSTPSYCSLIESHFAPVTAVSPLEFYTIFQADFLQVLEID